MINKLNTLKLPNDLSRYFGNDAFNQIMHMNGKPFRDVRGRRTIQVSLDGNSYFIKQHFGVGWGEIFKNLVTLKKPVLGALTEVHAIQKLDEIGIATTPLIAYGQRGINPANLESFVMTEDLGEIISLEELCADWQNNPPPDELKKKVIIALAQLAKKLHGAGLCHRDFYLCHFVVKSQTLAQGQIELILIDLHRMLMRQSTSGSAVMKDIAGLFFSAMDAGFTTTDWTLFKQHYLPQSANFWTQVETRAQKLYAKFNSEKFQKRLINEKAAIR
ncbi:MAG: lipopolysaccharide core heptose(I) kinase RfaP [Pseudomonadota bacterium]